MNLDFSEEQIMLRSMARDFLTDKFPKKVVRELEESETGHSPEIWKEMVELGWMGLALPEEYGGAGMTYLDLAVVLEEMGRACAPSDYFSTVILGAMPILHLGTEDQKKKYLPDISSGNSIFTFALTEESATYDASGIQLQASAGGGDYILNGTKMFVPDAKIADYIICVARTKKADNPEDGITMYIVDAKSPGIKCTLLNTIARDKLYEVVFENVKVPGENILGEKDNGWSGVKKVIDIAATSKCLDISGSLQQVFEMTLQYAKDRVAFGQPIGSFQAVQHHCANMAVDVNGTWLSAYQAAWKISDGLPCSWEVAIAKTWAGQACPRVTALAHQIHGAIGITFDHDLHYYTRRTKAAEAAWGDSDSYLRSVADALENGTANAENY
jgi:alkylation response protein AidB-like acyl-CoA dehydrogenase